MSDTGTGVKRLSPQQQLTGDYMRMAGNRSTVHGLVEVDVTDARARIRTIEEETGTHLSFTAFIVSCLAACVGHHPHVQRYRDWRGRLHEFDDVDVNVLVERETDGGRAGVPHVVRAADRRSVRSIHDELRRVKREDLSDQPVPRLERLARRLPGVLRRQMWRLPRWFPRRWKDLAGSVAVTSIGMFGPGGWAISPTNYTLQLTVGGIDEQPRLVDGDLRSREFLHLTVSVDHDVVDGAPAARFVDHLVDTLEAGHGLDAQATE